MRTPVPSLLAALPLALPSARTVGALALVAACLLAATPASAALTDNTDFTQAYYVRAAVGDIPRTTAQEPAGAWNVVEYVRATHTQGTETPVPFAAMPGAGVAECTCSQLRGDRGSYAINASEPSGTYVVSRSTSQPFQDAIAGRLPASADPAHGTSTAVNLYIPDGHTLELGTQASGPLPSTPENPGFQIWQVEGTTAAPYTGTWFAVHPGQASTPPVGKEPLPWLLLAVAFALGAILWAVLVSQGLVQKRSRKQVVAVASHVEAAQEAPAVLEAKKRFLMGALKDIELAKQNQELEPAVYDAVKADFKKQAVTVMRAIEERPGA